MSPLAEKRPPLAKTHRQMAAAPARHRNGPQQAFADNRPEATAQRQLQTMADTSPAAARLAALSAASPQSRSAAQLQRMADAPIQRLGGDTRGERALEYGLLGTTFGARAGVYGAAIGGALGAGYGYLSGYSTYSNHQKDAYADELGRYREWKRRRAEDASAYDGGEIYTFSGGTSDTIHGMLNEGKVMYTFDVGSRLRVSGNHDAIKHSLLAEDRDVYAAGTATLDDPAKEALGQAITFASERDLNALNMQGLKEGSNQRQHFQRLIQQAEDGLVSLGKAADASVGELTDEYERRFVSKPEAKLDVTEDSGHYSPTYDSGHKALEAWRMAGYSHISWTPRWRERRFFQTQVADVDAG